MSVQLINMPSINLGASCRREQTQGRGELRLGTLLAKIYFTKVGLDLGEVFTDVMPILEDVRMEADLQQIAWAGGQGNTQHHSNKSQILGYKVKVQIYNPVCSPSAALLILMVKVEVYSLISSSSAGSSPPHAWPVDHEDTLAHSHC